MANKYYLRRGYNASIHGFRTGDWSKSEEVHNHNENIYHTVFNRVVSGQVGVIYQRIPGHIVIVSRSTRAGYILQISHAWIKDGKIIPTGHANIKDFSDFLYNTDYFYSGAYFREVIA